MSGVFRPESANQAAAWVKQRLASNQPFAIRGASTRADDPQCDVLETTSLCGVRFFESENMVVGVEAGVPFAELQRLLRDTDMRLPVNPWFSGATTAGVFAANDDGPERLDQGGIRDFVIGVECVDGFGQLVKAGGRVVKNVSGYDVGRMLCGSLGGLGLITALHFKVMPAPVDPNVFCLESKDESWVTGMLERVHRAAIPLTWALAARWNGSWQLGLGFAGNQARKKRIEIDLSRAFTGFETVFTDDQNLPKEFEAFHSRALDTGYISPWTAQFSGEWGHLYVAADTVTTMSQDRLRQLGQLCDGILVLPIGGGIHLFWRSREQAGQCFDRIVDVFEGTSAVIWPQRLPSDCLARVGFANPMPAAWPLMCRLKRGLDPRGIFEAPFYSGRP